MTLQARGGSHAPPGRIGAHRAAAVYRRRRLWPYAAAGALAAAAGLVALGAYLLRPAVSVRAGRGGQLATLSLRGPGTRLSSATASLDGRTVALSDRGGALAPVSPLPAGAKVSVRVSARTPWWASWWDGPRITRTVSVAAPAASVASTVTEFAPGAEPRVQFTRPVGFVRWRVDGVTHAEHLAAPSRAVTLTLPGGHPPHGSIQVSATAHAWESLAAPATVTYFEGTGPLAVVSPAPGRDPSPTEAITLTFSQPVATLFGHSLPKLGVALLDSPPAGRWTEPDGHTLRFQPAPGALWPGQTLQVRLPAAVQVGGRSTTSLSFALAQGSVTRLQQELATLGYLPLRWEPAAGEPGAPTSVAAAGADAYSTPRGRFSWRWGPPRLLASLWHPGTYSIMTEAAVKAFENVSGLNTVGRANPLLWPYLAHALASGTRNPNGYTWVDVSKALPETLTVWHDGRAVIKARTNTGIAQSRTANGTFAVYLRYRSQVMRGRNPDGTKYADPVKWVSYFNGGDAIHGFVRGSYGFPQSLGCTELPFATAHKVYPFTPIGTLVTVH